MAAQPRRDSRVKEEDSPQKAQRGLRPQPKW